MTTYNTNMPPVHLSGGGIAANRPLGLAIANGASTIRDRGISLAHVQICPQNFGAMTDKALEDLFATPGCEETAWRLHANARVEESWARQDCSALVPGSAYWIRLVAVLRKLGQPYSLHPGLAKSTQRRLVRREENRAIQKAARLQDEAGVPVMLEGMYPRRGRQGGEDLPHQYLGGASLSRAEQLGNACWPSH